MTTSIVNTGEAFLSPDDKRYARVTLITPHIEHAHGLRLTPALTGLGLAAAVAALILAASAV